jgi:hypothetical protein
MRQTQLAFAFLVLACAAGCGPTGSGGDTGASSTPKPAAELPPMPPMPTYAADYLGRPLTDVVTSVVTTCIGSADMVGDHFGGASPGVQIWGWGWDTSGRRPFSRFLVADADGVVRGAGVGGHNRPDVPAARPDQITVQSVGYDALTSQTSGVAKVYGVDETAHTACLLGAIDDVSTHK